MNVQSLLPHHMDLDTGEVAVAPDRAIFLKNVDFLVAPNQRTGAEGGNAVPLTPIPSPVRYDTLDFLPAVERRTQGFYESPTTGNGYAFVWGADGSHLIYRILRETGVCELVIKNAFLNFQRDPRYFIARTRAVDYVFTRVSRVTGAPERVTYLIFVDGCGVQRMVCVEDCIATGGFDAALFPYFKCAEADYDADNILRLGLTPPMDQVEVTPIARDLDDPDELLKETRLNHRGWQFRLKFIDVWGRESEHGPISTLYLNSAGGLTDGSTLPRCLKLRFSAGAPIVDKIQIEYRYITGAVRGIATESDWMIHETISKYNDCEKVDWWKRKPNPAYAYDAAENKLEYTFCADKGDALIPVTETNRIENPMPLVSGGVVSMNRKLALVNNERGFQPLDCQELGKVKYAVLPPDAGDDCPNQTTRKITIYAVIWNVLEGVHAWGSPLFTYNGRTVFAAANCGVNADAFYYHQVLPAGQEGIIGYLAGTGIYGVSKQCKYNISTGEIEEVGLDYTKSVAFGDKRRYLPLQKWELTVPAGTYVFRLASHEAAPSDDYEKTSTRLLGSMPIDLSDFLQTRLSELVINACDGDVDLLATPLIIADLTRMGDNFTPDGGLVDCAGGNRSNVVEGYLYEDEINQIPVEQAQIIANKSGAVQNLFTDHNGYYFGATRKNHFHIRLYGWKNGQPDQLLAQSADAIDSRRYKADRLTVYQHDQKYPQGDRYQVRGQITLCEGGVGIPGALVVLEGSGYAYTDSTGNFSIPAHDTGHTADPRQHRLVYSQRPAVELQGCADPCSRCFAAAPVVAPRYTGVERTVPVAALTARLRRLGDRGPQTGGRYGIAISKEDWQGRMGFLDAADGHYVNIPSIQQTGRFGYSRVAFDIKGMQLPAETKWISFWVTENLNFEDFLTWAADKVEFIDATGVVNNVAPSAIRIYYRSLNEYNKQNNFSTTTRWQFITEATSQLVLGDEVEFITNGDGTIYTERIKALVQYDQQGSYIQIEYTEKLKTLTENAQFRLVRPPQNQHNEFYYEVGPRIRVVDGVPQVTTGDIPIIDSYMQVRGLPVPILNEDGEPDHNELRSYPHPFEHPSPSDFWGDHCSNKGRVNVRNQGQGRHRLPMEIIRSKALSTEGSFNGLNYFDLADRVLFDEQQWGAITGCIAEVGTMLVICERDNFTVNYDDDRVYVTPQGQVQVRSFASSIGRPERKIGGNYGCLLRDINTICSHGGLVTFLDASRAALVAHNFAEGVNLVAEQAAGWMLAKIRSVYANISTIPRYFHAAIDPRRNQLLLTDAYLRPDDTDFTNDLAGPDPTRAETIVIDLSTRRVRGMRSFVPEYYGALAGEQYDQQLIQFKDAEGWRSYHTGAAGDYNVFFGRPCETWIEVVYNQEAARVKVFLWNEVYCRGKLLYIDRIISESGQRSRLMPLWFDRRDQYYAADFKCALTTQADPNMAEETGRNVILGGDRLYGRWLRCRYRGRSADKSRYFELTALAGHFL